MNSLLKNDIKNITSSIDTSKYDIKSINYSVSLLQSSAFSVNTCVEHIKSGIKCINSAFDLLCSDVVSNKEYVSRSDLFRIESSRGVDQTHIYSYEATNKRYISTIDTLSQKAVPSSIQDENDLKIKSIYKTLVLLVLILALVLQQLVYDDTESRCKALVIDGYKIVPSVST